MRLFYIVSAWNVNGVVNLLAVEWQALHLPKVS